MLGFTEYGRRIHGVSSSALLARYAREVLEPRFTLVREDGSGSRGGRSRRRRGRPARDAPGVEGAAAEALRRAHRELADERRALLRSRQPRADQVDALAAGLERLTVRQILSTADFSNTAGRFPDPFHLVSDPAEATHAFPAANASPARRPPKTIPALLDLDLFGRGRDDFPKGGMKNGLPTAVHVIWMGGPFTRERGHAAVATWAGAGRVANRFLWTDRSRDRIARARGAEKRGFAEMKAFCREQRFAVLCVDEVFDRRLPMRLQHLFDMLRLQHEWAAASDILRYELLYRFGGVYADTDVACRQKIDWHRVPDVPGAPSHRFGMGQMHDGLVVQAALFATAENPVLGTILDFVERSASRDTGQMLRYTPSARPAHGEYNYTQRRMDEVLARTGPTAVYVSLIAHFLGTAKPLREIFPNLITVEEDWALDHESFYGIYSDRILVALAEGNPQGEMMPVVNAETRAYFRDRLGMGRALLAIGSEASWLGVRRTPSTTLQEARVALTTLLFRLQADPTVLDLVPLEHTARNDTMVVEILDALSSGFAETLERVEVAQIAYEPHDTPQAPVGETARALLRSLREAGFDARPERRIDAVKGRDVPAGQIDIVHRVAFR